MTVVAARANLERVLALAVQQLSARTGAAESFIDVPDGVMVAFYPPAALARQLAIPDGEPPDDLHITLALPGKVSELSAEQRARLPVIVRGFAMISRPLAGSISGLAEFPARDGKKPVVYLIDVPGLPAWRQRLVEVLALNGYSVANNHGFVPHMTLKYAVLGEPIATNYSDAKLEFNSVSLVMGGRRKDYPLGGNPDVDESLDSFSGVPGRPRNELAAVEQYQRDLEDAYSEWADDAAGKLAVEPDHAKRDALIALLLLLLLARLQDSAHAELPNAVLAGLGGGAGTADVYAKLAQIMAANDAYLRDSLIPAIQDRITLALSDADVLRLIAAGKVDEIKIALGGWLVTLTARVGSYAGAWWQLFNWARGMTADDQNYTVKAYLHVGAAHCEECPQFHSEDGKEYPSFAAYLDATGGRVPGDYLCRGNCRCSIQFGDKSQITAQNA